MSGFRTSKGGLPPQGPVALASASARGVNDVRVKPKLLRTLLAELVPEADDKSEFSNPLKLSRVVKAVKTQDLLSECATEQDLARNWSSAVDAWASHLSELISSQSPDKVWAAICLLGLTCQECSSARFVASYRQWFDSILPHIQTLSDAPFLRAASFASMSDLLTRLAGIHNEKKNGISLAAKLVLPVLKLLNEDASESELEEALCLLCNLLNVYPSSISQHCDNVEASIFSRFASENGSINLFKKLGQCLIMLPKCKGTVNSWSLMMQKVILFLNDQLTFAFQGLEKETAGNEVVRLIVPTGRDPPSPLGGVSIMPEQAFVSKVCILMSCCGMMIAGSYPVQVAVPAHPLIALIKRVLKPFSPSSEVMIITRLEFICSELPVLHACTLDLLTTIVNGLRSHLLPHVGGITRILIDYIGTCSLPEPRIKVYSVMKAMLLSMGIGIAIVLTDVVINNTFADLDSSAPTYHAPYLKVSEEETLSQNKEVSEASIQQPPHKRRKHAASTALHEDTTPSGGLAKMRYQKPAPIPVRIAALEVLEALLTVAGAVRSDVWRSKVDELLYRVSLDACKVIPVYEIATPISQDLQVASLRALLASLLSPGCSTQLHLLQSLELFRKGSQATGTSMGAYCQHALLALEPLIHPRAPMLDFEALGDAKNGTEAQREIDEELVKSGMPDDETEAGIEPSDAPSVLASMDGAAGDEGTHTQQHLDIDLNIGFEESDFQADDY